MRVGVSLPVRELQDDLVAIRDFAQAADSLGFTHLRVPEQVVRGGRSGHLHEPLTLLSYVAAVTDRIELVPSVIILPARQTALVAKQAAEIDRLSNGRLRLGIGVGGSREEYEALGQDFSTRGQRCDEQLELLRLLWTNEHVDFEGRWDRISGAGINPLPVQQPIPTWIGGASPPSEPVLRRIGRFADGWFAIVSPSSFPDLQARIAEHARAAGREPAEIGSEGAVAVSGRSSEDWLGTVERWRGLGASHFCIRTLGAGLDAAGHLDALRKAHKVLGESWPGGLAAVVATARHLPQ